MWRALLRALSPGALVSLDAALVELLHFLRLHSYHFTTVTPATHSIVLRRRQLRQPDLRDIFGWNRPFAKHDLEPLLYSLLEQAGAIEVAPSGELRSLLRVASLNGQLFLHSAFPTEAPDAVFFGPDTYRFLRFVGQHAALLETAGSIVDMGAGSGAGGITLARQLDAELTLVDVNPNALRFARINAAAAGLDVQSVETDKVPDSFDLLIGNAPYLMDASKRAYRDGGAGLLGGAISLDWICQGLERLRPGRKILLYTGAAYVDGRAPLLTAVVKECAMARASLCIDEIDPDVFGDDLETSAYKQVERIAAIGIKIG